MSDTLHKIQILVASGEVRISDHGYDELAEDNLLAADIVNGIESAQVVEDYPDFHKGPCVLTLQYDGDNNPIHALWGIPRGASTPAVLITAYRPNPDRWTDGFRRRKNS